MAYKTLTTIVTDREADAAALAAAREMAERRSAHLDVQCLGIDPARYEPLPVGSAAVIMETGAAEARARIRPNSSAPGTDRLEFPRVDKARCEGYLAMHERSLEGP